eukprot:IDg15198t1
MAGRLYPRANPLLPRACHRLCRRALRASAPNAPHFPARDPLCALAARRGCARAARRRGELHGRVRFAQQASRGSGARAQRGARGTQRRMGDGRREACFRTGSTTQRDVRAQARRIAARPRAERRVRARCAHDTASGLHRRKSRHTLARECAHTSCVETSASRARRHLHSFPHAPPVVARRPSSWRAPFNGRIFAAGKKRAPDRRSAATRALHARHMQCACGQRLHVPIAPARAHVSRTTPACAHVMFGSRLDIPR